MMLYIISFLLFSSASFALTEEKLKTRIYSHLLIGDALQAVQEAKKAVESFPDSLVLRKALLYALCQFGSEVQAWDQWCSLCPSVQDYKKERYLIEMLSWSALNKGQSATQISVRFNTLIGATLTKDSKAIPMLLKGMRDSNALLRSTAIKLCTQFKDEVFKEELAALLKREKVWHVRLEVIRAIGTLHIYELIEPLQAMIEDPCSLAEEKTTAMMAVVEMSHQISRQKLESLIRQPRSLLRQLGAEIIAHFERTQDSDLLLQLLSDSSAEVRVSALNALALLRVKCIEKKPIRNLVENCLKDSSPLVAITAGYLLLINQEKVGKAALSYWLQSENLKWQRLAAAAISASGRFGVDLAFKGIHKVKDPYVRLNLCIGLIGQRAHTAVASDTIFSILSQEAGLWMWDKQTHSLFSPIVPSDVTYIESIPNYPQIVDQLARLDILSILHFVQYPKALQLTKDVLQKKDWNLTAAAAVLLQEGDEKAGELVGSLLDDPDEKVRMQAALILGLMYRDPVAVDVLQKVYPNADQRIKITILEALAQIGDANSIPFLLEVLKEPFQTLRIVAASALIQCLYH
ncbi:MAG: HEAT repeat domain-containing protein [Chlamydiales bacterium]|jgi:HEAT repeat protein|nr:HEAT repeat domain-containing protein [Chlamydiales bacterium]